ncbi:hypothetical protein KM043_010820 [Ampulex compressa]|nr:hypothetical protein KM043_010820 [Ampulex compressa]
MKVCTYRNGPCLSDLPAVRLGASSEASSILEPLARCRASLVSPGERETSVAPQESAVSKLHVILKPNLNPSVPPRGHGIAATTGARGKAAQELRPWGIDTV